jgi:hypothetical protein
MSRRRNQHSNKSRQQQQAPIIHHADRRCIVGTPLPKPQFNNKYNKKPTAR